MHAKVYYPSKDPGGGQIACGGPFPAVVYTHGRRNPNWALCPGWSNPGPVHQDYRQADGILSRLAAAGIIVISVDNSWGWVDPSARGSIVINTLAYLRDQNQPGGWLEGSVDLQRVGLSGHSLGGAAAVYAAVEYRNPPFDALNLSNVQIQALGVIAPGWCRAFGSPPDGVPMLVIHGTNEHIIQVGDTPVELYGEGNGPKHLVVVKELMV